MKFHLPDRNYLIDVSAIIFGISSWITVSGVGVETPVLVQALPEGWRLPSYTTVVTQLGNIGPIVYGLLHQVWPRKVHETSATYTIMTIGVLSTFLLAFLWDKTSWIAGELHSVSLLVLLFFLALMDCTSSLVYLPFMSIFKEKYILSCFIGEGFSGLLPGLVAMAQGIGGTTQCHNVSHIVTVNGTNVTEYKWEEYTPNPVFSANVFFFILSVLVMMSFLAFFFLRYHPIARQEYARTDSHTKLKVDAVQPSSSSSNLLDEPINSSGHLDTIRIRSGNGHGYGTADVQILPEDSCDENIVARILTKRVYFYLLFLQTWVNFFGGGVLNSIQSYSCLPYGNSVYHLTATLSSVASPFASFLAFFLPNPKTWTISLVTGAGTIIGLYLLVLAALSPNPPLVGTNTGSAIVVVCWVLFNGLASLMKALTATVFRVRGKRALFWCGVWSQVGSASGAILMFCLVNVAQVFTAKDACAS